jgi:hypothetical protein
MWQMQALLASQWKDLLLLLAKGLAAGSHLLSLVSHPLGRLDRSSQPSYLISFFPVFSLPYMSMNLCYVLLN